VTVVLGDEEALLSKARAGDAAAFADLVRPLVPKLLAVAGALVGQDGADVVQEALVDAYRGLSRFRGEAALATWLVRLTMNRAQSQLRRRPPPMPDAEAVARLADWQADQPSLDPELAVIRSEGARDLWAALGKMPEPLRLAVVLHDAFAMSQGEIATITGWPLGSVKSNIRRGRVLVVSLLGGTP
jgi:RNA polymerase sigma-70 factor (ECF subfamily)